MGITDETVSADFKYRKLRARIKEVYGTESNFAEALNLSNMSVSRRFNGRVQFTSDDMRVWSKMLGIPLAEVGKYFFD